MNVDATMLSEAGNGCQAPPSVVLGFAAPIEPGKTTVSTLVAERLGAPRVSFGDYLRRLAQERGLELTRETRLAEIEARLKASEGPQPACPAGEPVR